MTSVLRTLRGVTLRLASTASDVTAPRTHHFFGVGAAAPPLERLVEDWSSFVVRARLGVVVLRPEPGLATLVLAPVRPILIFCYFGLGLGARRPREGLGTRRRLLALVLVVVLDGLCRYWRTGNTGRLRLLRRFWWGCGVPTYSTSR